MTKTRRKLLFRLILLLCIGVVGIGVFQARPLFLARYYLERYKWASEASGDDFTFDENPDEIAALDNLVSLGPIAMGPLLGLMDERYGGHTGTASQTIARMGPGVVPKLLNWAQRNPDDRWRVARVIGELGPDGAAGVPLLLDMVKNDKEIWAAVRALGRIGPKSAPAVLPLIDAFHDSAHKRERPKILFTLGQIGPGAVEAVPFLMTHIQSDSFRRSAQSALGKIGRGALPALKEALADSDPKLRLGAAMSFFYMKANAAPAVDELCHAILDTDNDVRWKATEALVNIGPPAHSKLLGMLDEDDPLTKIRAGDAIRTIKTPFQAAMPKLIEFLEHDNEKVRWTGVNGLIHIGEAAVPALIEKLHHPKESCRLFTLHTIASLRPPPKSAAPALRNAATSDPSEMIRKKARSILEYILSSDE